MGKKFVFYLMNEKGKNVLLSFLDKVGSDHIEFVVLSEDKSVKNDYFVDIRNICKSNNIKYFLKNNAPKFNGYKFAIGWRWIIEDVENLIVLHDSILPRYRGFAPLVNMLINGEKEIGVTALFASEEYDKGPIIAQKKCNIEYPIKIKKAIEMISELYSELVNEIAQKVINNEILIGIPQNEEEATYSLWRDEKDYFINWSLDSSKIKRMIDAVGFPYGGAKTFLNNNEIIIIEDAEEYPDLVIENRDIGKVIMIVDNCPVVVCGKGLLKITSAKYLDGKSVLPINKFRIRLGGN